MNNNPTVVVRLEQSGNRINAYNTVDDVKMTSSISTSTRKKAFAAGMGLGQFTTKTGSTQWRQVNLNDYTTPVTPEVSSVDIPTDHAEVLNFIHSSYSLKPRGLMMNELKW